MKTKILTGAIIAMMWFLTHARKRMILLQ